MKKTITVLYEDEKLTALKMYLEQKNQTVEGELEKLLEGLYVKTVPVGVREFLSMRLVTAEKKKKPSSGVGDGGGSP